MLLLWCCFLTAGALVCVELLWRQRGPWPRVSAVFAAFAAVLIQFMFIIPVQYQGSAEEDLALQAEGGATLATRTCCRRFCLATCACLLPHACALSPTIDSPLQVLPGDLEHGGVHG